MNEKKELWRDLLECISVSGNEEKIQQIVVSHMEKYADEIRTDEMNSTVCVWNPDSDKKIMLCAHADEIGLIVSRITEEGQLQAVARGGIITSIYPGHQVCVRTGSKVLYGVVQAARDKMKEGRVKTADLFIDIGAGNKKEAESLVHIGDPIVFDTRIHSLQNGRFSARALDDRLGVYIIMEASKRAKEQGCGCGIYSTAAAGEETTKNGAYWSAMRIRPSLAIVVDVTWTSDYPGTNPAETGEVRLGGGPVLCDSPIVSKGLNAKMEACAQKKGIPVQWEVAERLSCTDADKIHFSGEGVPVVLVSIPLRYMHTPAEVADWQDVENCIELIKEFLLES